VVGGLGEVAATTVCRRIKVSENGQPGTSDYFVRRPLQTSVSVTKAAGKETIFENAPGFYWQPGDKIAYIEIASGTQSFSVEED